MLEVFMKHSVEDLPRIRVPEPFNQKNELHSDDQVSRILKYIYGNQVSESDFIRFKWANQVHESNQLVLFAWGRTLV